MRFPYAIVGVILGALFMQTWPGQDEYGVVMQIALYCGGGFLLGLLCEMAAKRRAGSLPPE